MEDNSLQTAPPPHPGHYKPGQSGNPGGRPRTAPITKALREKLDETDEKTGLTNAEMIAQALIKKAKGADIWAIREITELIGEKRTHPPDFLSSSEISGARQRLMAKLIKVEQITVEQNQNGDGHSDVVGVAERLRERIKAELANGREET